MARQSSPIDEAFHVNGFPLLEFDRRPFHNHLLTGFVLGWNAKLTLIQIVEDQQFRLNGYAIFRNSDVKRWRPVSKELFLARAARIHPICRASVSFMLRETARGTKTAKVRCISQEKSDPL